MGIPAPILGVFCRAALAIRAKLLYNKERKTRRRREYAQNMFFRVVGIDRLREGHHQAASVRGCIRAEVHSRVAPLNAPLCILFCPSAARTGSRFIAFGDAAMQGMQKSGLPVGGDGPSRYRRKECLLLYNCTAKTWVVPRSLRCVGFVPDSVRGRGFLFFVFRAKTARFLQLVRRASVCRFWANG